MNNLFISSSQTATYPHLLLKKAQLPYLIVLLSFLTVIPAQAQKLLERKISIRVNNQPLDEVLKQIGELGGFSFSYNPDVIDIRSRVSINVTSQRIHEILNELFKGKVTFKEHYKYIILQSNPKKENETPENFNLDGYILDKSTGEKLANASIYDPYTLTSTISDRYGYYKIRLPSASSPVKLEVRKHQYVGKSVIVSGKKNTYLPISLNPDTIKALSVKPINIAQNTGSPANPKIQIPQFEYTSSTQSPSDTAIGTDYLLPQQKLKTTYQRVRKDFSIAFASAKQAINTRNITDTLYRPVQTSVLPFLSTNRELSGNVVNDYSFNVFAGYSLGTNKLEIGGLFNADRGHVKGIQLAGIANVVGNNVTGFQYATALNVVMGSVIGFQYSTLLNFTAGNFQGLQLAGVGNVLLGSLYGWQVSGGYNYAKTVRKGHQLSAVNYADSSGTTPFGLFSFVRKNGYRRYEIATDEFNYFNTSYKTGMNSFYNIFTLGFNFLAHNKPIGSIGYGFGTARNLGHGWMLNADVTANVVLSKETSDHYDPAGLFRLVTAIERKVGNRFSLAFGPSINLLAGNHAGIAKDDRRFFSTFWLGGKPDQTRSNYAWIGFQAAIRFRDKL